MQKPMRGSKIIKLDIDLLHEFENRYHFLDDFLKTRKVILESLGYKIVNINVKKSRKGYHVIIEINKEVPMLEILKLQFLLGDDINRVNYNLMRYTYWGEEIARLYNILFSIKEKRKVQRK